MRALMVVGSLVATASAAGPSLLCVADWGGVDDASPTSEAQVATASGMARVARERGAEGVLMLGDNFYLHGVRSANSSRFGATFEKVYSRSQFGDLPFHVIAGNHDHLGHVQAQIDYAATSQRWAFPSLFYKLAWNWTAASGAARIAEIVMIDTVVLAGIREEGGAGSGPADLAAAAEWFAWIEQQLGSSRADFLWVAGHYPIYSAGDDGTTPVLVEKLLPMLRRHGAHYICGHDHLAQVLNMDGVFQFQNGMGMECCYGLGSINTVPPEYIKYAISGKSGQGPTIGGATPPKMLGGFNSMAFGDDAVTITLHKEDGEELCAAQVPRRRSGAASIDV